MKTYYIYSHMDTFTCQADAYFLEDDWFNFYRFGWISRDKVFSIKQSDVFTIVIKDK